MGNGISDDRRLCQSSRTRVDEVEAVKGPWDRPKDGVGLQGTLVGGGVTTGRSMPDTTDPRPLQPSETSSVFHRNGLRGYRLATLMVGLRRFKQETRSLVCIYVRRFLVSLITLQCLGLECEQTRFPRRPLALTSTLNSESETNLPSVVSSPLKLLLVYDHEFLLRTNRVHPFLYSNEPMKETNALFVDAT